MAAQDAYVVEIFQAESSNAIVALVISAFSWVCNGKICQFCGPSCGVLDEDGAHVSA